MKVWQLFENFKLSELNANFAELLTGVNAVKASYLTANKTVYVATTGNDTTGDGTSGNPYKTITKGLSVIPKNLNGFAATLYIAGGTYAESVVVNGFHGGMVYVVLNGNITVTSLSIMACQYVFINGSSQYTITTTATTAVPFQVARGSSLSSLSVSYLVSTGNTQSGFYCGSNSSAHITGTLTANNALYGVIVSGESKAYISNIAGSGNDTGIYGAEGSVFSYRTKTISATTDHILSGGSIITNDLLSNTATQWNE